MSPHRINRRTNRPRRDAKRRNAGLWREMQKRAAAVGRKLAASEKRRAAEARVRAEYESLQRDGAEPPVVLG